MDPKAMNQVLRSPSTPEFPNFDDPRVHAPAFRTRVKQLLQDADTLQYEDFLQLRIFTKM
jgi:hypothetical protein